MCGMNRRRWPVWLVGLEWFCYTILAVIVAVIAIVVGCKERAALRLGRNIEVPPTFLGKNVLVTGSTAGIGFGTAVYLLKLGAHVIVHGPNEERTRKAAEDAFALAGGLGRATPLAASLDDFAAVRAMTAKLMRLVPQVHVILLNAGYNYGAAPVFGDYFKKKMMAMPDSDFVGKSGKEKVMSINHFGHFLLTMGLQPIWAPDVKIVIVTGNGMWQGDWRRVIFPGRYPWEKNKGVAFLAYEDSKLANVCFGRALQSRLRPGQYAVVHDPGQIRTVMSVDRRSKVYTSRSYMSNYKDPRWVWWHMSVEQAAERLVRSAYVTRKPVPDVVYSYWMPSEIWRHRNHQKYVVQRDYWRQRWPVKFLMNQIWSFGPLYDGLGPGCGGAQFLEYFWNYTLNATGNQAYFDQKAFNNYYRMYLAATVEPMRTMR